MFSGSFKNVTYKLLVYKFYNNNNNNNLCWGEISEIEKHERKVKTRMGTSTRNSDKKPTKTTESDKTKSAEINRNKKNLRYNSRKYARNY